MLQLRADPHEFDHPDSEESVDYASADAKQFPSVVEFLAACPNATHPSPSVPPARFDSFDTDRFRQARKRFSLASVPGDATTRVARDAWDHFEFVAEFGATFVWFRWQTSA